MFIDSTYIIFVLPAVILALWAQTRVNSTFNKFSKINSSRGMTGAEAAVKILNMHGLYNVKVERIGGNLTDHFDPRTNVVRLSQTVYSSTSVAAIGVAAHEAGHAVQHATGYTPIKLRNLVLPVANIGNMLGLPIAILGMFLGFPGLIDFGIILYTAMVAFQLVTLPVEFNASRRAIQVLNNQGILNQVELEGTKKVLSAAAMTYVAAAASAIGTLLRLLVLRGRDD